MLLPETLTTCDSSFTLTAYTLGIGTPPNTTVQFLTLLHLAGTVHRNGTDTQENFTFTLVSMTVA
ncbi:MAG: hypothetical protein OK422_01215 [Thaumarchaeota archaeon]|nr:hypothetical protein [Nitrososphaerota archaeon]